MGGKARPKPAPEKKVKPVKRVLADSDEDEEPVPARKKQLVTLSDSSGEGECVRTRVQPLEACRTAEGYDLFDFISIDYCACKAANRL